MFENVCTLPLSSQLFAQAVHPTEPILAVGLAGGHVESFRLPVVKSCESSDEDDMNMSIASTGTSTIDTEWRTRRHRGSCRTLIYSVDGEALFSSGTDGLVKVASSHTGRVFAKIAIPQPKTDLSDAPSLLHALSPEVIILATDSAALYVYDLRQSNHIESKPAQKYQPHNDYVTSITSLPPSASSTSGYSKQWISTGGTTLAVTDLRKGVISQSENQEEELLTSIYVGGLPMKPGKSNGEKIIIGESSGFLTIWEKGFWDDQQERINITSRKNDICALESLALVPDEISDGGKNIVVGVESGDVHIVRLGPNKITSTLNHDEIEGVVALDFDIENRLISGGGTYVKVWQEGLTLDSTDSEEEEESSNSDSSDGNGVEKASPLMQKRQKLKTINGNMNAHGIMGFHSLD
ncbi:WD repeat-containing protein jip5 [Erysiphe necator]|uniref:WD repeat-containing protein JIP5 n=1 Tax=Uncinula necator TaxID=52586 RepID=A0A0B1PEG1_UNCNE|nr:WD repeat-containing protein jip5 [Erysiphe necator]KHJ35029.1 putative wd repeat protein [Erysiphe necator]